MKNLMIWALAAPGATAAPATTTTTQIVIATLSAGGLGAILAAIVTGLFSKKKLGAEATEIITKAAAGVVASLNSEIDRLTRMIARQDEEHRLALERMKDESRRELSRIKSDHLIQMGEVKRVLELHTAWDQVAISRLMEIGIELPPAPDLMPRFMQQGSMDR